MRKTVYIFLFLLLSLLYILTSCDNAITNHLQKENHLIFVGTLLDGAEAETRAPNMMGVSRDTFETKFYFARLAGEKACATYKVPVEHPGLFRHYGNLDSLVWYSHDLPHVFVGWTMPWILDYPIDDIEYKVNYDPYIENFEDGTTISFDANDPMYAQLQEHDVDNTNCKILETFVGTRSEEITFNENGDYVILYFRHLVSKIYINSVSFSMMDPDGKIITRTVQGKMTFKNMPSEGIFYREREGFPIVEANPEALNEVTYDLSAGAVFYVCPGIDFSQVEFAITPVNGSSEYMGYGDFLGDFKSILFNRVETDWWDKEHESDPNWETTLYAGETMTLNLNLRQGKGTFVSVSINGWNNQTATEGSAYQYNGIYDSSQIREAYYMWGNDGYTDEMEENLFSKYGDTYYDENGDEIKEYRIYNDCTWTQAIRLGKKYSVNGMGHTITFTGTYSNNQVRISRIKDIYLTDGAGNTVYIDENYNVYKIEENGNMKFTGTMKPLDDNMNSYLINLTTGEFKQDPGI